MATQRKSTGSTPLVEMIKEVYDTKLRMKAVLETKSNDFEEYATLTHNKIVDSYNNGYIDGFNDGYHSLDPFTELDESYWEDEMHEKITFVPSVPEYSTGTDIDNLIIMMKDSLRCRLLLKDALGTNSDEFVTYPDLLLAEMQSQYDTAYAKGRADGIRRATKDMGGDFLTFNMLESGEIKWRLLEGYVGGKTIYYSKNDGDTWTSITATRGGASISANYGEKILFKGFNAAYGGGNHFESNARFYLSGNIMSLIDGDNFILLKEFDETNDYAFDGLFYGCTTLAYAHNLLLPATTLAPHCYYDMFRDCSSMIKAPILHATTLADMCYACMFAGCTSLTTAPALPATTLANECYFHMFYGCTSLTTAPSLPATTCVDWCYLGMFRECTSLTSAPSLPATTLAENCYWEMFKGCTSLTTAPSLPATTCVQLCYYEMFAGCTSLTTAPALPATTLAESCYYEMFAGCTSLTTAPALPATTLATSCYAAMFYGCTALTDAPALPATKLEPGCYGSMFRECTSLTSAPSLPATKLANGCYSHMFSGCTSLTAAPVLPATTLVSQCYEYMFDGCTSLTYIKCLATNTTFYLAINHWVRYVPTGSTGQFYKASNASWTTAQEGNNYTGIPSGWRIYNAA